MLKVIVISTHNNSDSYSSKLAQHFTKGAKEAGIEVETISLGAKTMEEAYEIGKRLSIPAKKETFTIPSITILSPHSTKDILSLLIRTLHINPNKPIN